MAYRRDDSQEKLFEKLIKINRVTKVTKGGKNLAFRAFVIVGDQDGNVGLATAKSKEVPVAIRRSIDKAKRQMHAINVVDGTIPHRIIGEYKASKVVLRPAPEGTGVIAGGSIRILLESLGIENIVAKSIGSNNSLNMAKAALNGLLKLKKLSDVEERRGVKISLGGRFNAPSEAPEVGDKNDSN
jgi:small subunit ribosomal protein S5